MSVLDRFRREWSMRFPSDTAPQLACLIPLTTRSTVARLAAATISISPQTSPAKVRSGASVQQAVAAWEAGAAVGAATCPLNAKQQHQREAASTSSSSLLSSPSSSSSSLTGPLNSDAVERTLKTFESNVENLERELERNRFVVEFLRCVLGIAHDERSSSAVVSTSRYHHVDVAVATDDEDPCDYSSTHGALSIDRSRSKSTPLLPVTAAAAGDDASTTNGKPVPPVRHRRKAVRDRLLQSSPSTPNGNQPVHNWRTSVYEEVVPYNPSLQLPQQQRQRQQPTNNSRHQTWSSSSSISSASTSENSYVLMHSDDDDEGAGERAVPTPSADGGDECEQQRRPSVPQLRAGREAMRGRVRTWCTQLSADNEDGGDDVLSLIIRQKINSGRRFSVMPRPTATVINAEGDDDVDELKTENGEFMLK